MCREKITIAFRKFISLGGYQKPRNSIFQLKELTNQPPLKVWIFVSLAWLGSYSLVVTFYEAAQYDWYLAGSSLIFTVLYVCTYRSIEGKFIRLPDVPGANKKRLFRRMYFNRWLFFAIFLILEAIAFLHWDLVQPNSGAAILVPVWLGVIAASCIQLGNLQEAFSFRIKWPKNQHQRDAFYTLYMTGVLFTLIILTLLMYSAGDWLYSHERLKGSLGALASGAIVASFFTALGNIYFTRIKNRLLEE